MIWRGEPSVLLAIAEPQDRPAVYHKGHQGHEEKQELQALGLKEPDPFVSFVPSFVPSW